MKTLSRISLVCLSLTLLALPVLAVPTTSGTALAADGPRIVLASSEGVHLDDVRADVERPDELSTNQVVVVQSRDAEQRTASRLIPVDERGTSVAGSDRSSGARQSLPRTSNHWVAILLIGLGALGAAILLGRRI